jgi:hypothetical protein
VTRTQECSCFPHRPTHWAALSHQRWWTHQRNTALSTSLSHWK